MRHPADAYIGIPFVAHGDTHEGVSCWGLVQLYYREQLGIELKSYDYGPEDRREIALAVNEAVASGEWFIVVQPIDGDVVTMAHRERPYHLGFYAAGKVVHANHLGGFVVSESASELIKRGYGRIRYLRHE